MPRDVETAIEKFVGCSFGEFLGNAATAAAFVRIVQHLRSLSPARRELVLDRLRDWAEMPAAEFGRAKQRAAGDGRMP